MKENSSGAAGQPWTSFGLLIAMLSSGQSMWRDTGLSCALTLSLSRLHSTDHTHTHTHTVDATNRAHTHSHTYTVDATNRALQKAA